MISYKIIEFNETIGQIKILVEEFGIIPINLHPDDNDCYPTGQELDNYIRGFIPVHELERLEKVKIVSNSAEIQSLIEPLPTAPPPLVEPFVYIV